MTAMPPDIDLAAVMAEHREHRWHNGMCWRGPFVVDGREHQHCEPYRLAESLVAAQQDIEEYASILDRSSSLLRGVANALNGPPPPLTSWSYHDLPEKARAAVDALTAEQQDNRSTHGERDDALSSLAVEIECRQGAQRALAAEQAKVARVGSIAAHKRQQAEQVEALTLKTIGGRYQQEIRAKSYRSAAELIEAALADQPEQEQAR